MSAAGYDLLLKVEYKGRTLWDCAGSNPTDPANHPGCTVVPPGGLQAKLHLPVLFWPPCLPLPALAACAEIRSLVLLVFAMVRLQSRNVQQSCKLGCTEHPRGAKQVLQGQK